MQRRPAGSAAGAARAGRRRLVDVEVFVNATYGYDVRGEIVGERGTVALADGGRAVLKQGGRRSDPVPADWRDRFGTTFDAELQDWLTATAAGTAAGPGCWDGYAATVIAETCHRALHTGARATAGGPRPRRRARRSSGGVRRHRDGVRVRLGGAGAGAVAVRNPEQIRRYVAKYGPA